MGEPPTLKSEPYEVKAVADLTPGERGVMYELMAAHFACHRDGFERDLEEKEWVLLLRSEGRLAGFSTLMRLGLSPTETAFFSGDTIMDKSLRQGSALTRLWARHVFGLTQASGPDHTFYWFLICSGYRTYRFLPLFFKEYYPALERPTPPEQQAMLDPLGRGKFGESYCDGVVVPRHPTPLLEPEIRHGDKHAAFFAQRNPEHRQGYELACLTRLQPDNLTAAGRRFL